MANLGALGPDLSNRPNYMKLITHSSHKGWLLSAYLRVGGESVNLEFLQFTATSLLRRLQAQTLPKATPRIGQIHSCSKIAITFELLKGF